MKKAIEDMAMHYEMIQLLSGISSQNINDITLRIISYLETLQRNQITVFWRVAFALHTDNAKQMIVSNKHFHEIILNAFCGNKEIEQLLSIPQEQVINMYLKSTEAL